MRRSGGEALEGSLGQRYLRVSSPRGGDGFAVNESSRELLGEVDAVVFDCDGVLVDARKSYDATIRVVVETMVEELTGVRLHLARVVPGLISTIRRTGGFNSDWDTSYALSLFSLVALGQRKDGRTPRLQGDEGADQNHNGVRFRAERKRAGGGRRLPREGIPVDAG